MILSSVAVWSGGHLKSMQRLSAGRRVFTFRCRRRVSGDADLRHTMPIFAMHTALLPSQVRPPHSRSKRLARCALRACLVLVVFAGGTSQLLAQEEASGNRSSERVPGGEMVRGTVTGTTANALTVKTETGDLYKITATENTRVLRSRESSRFAGIRLGEGVGAAGVMDFGAKTLHAAFIAVIDAEEVRKAQAELGKSFIFGRISSINELKLGIQRPDGVRQVIAVDETTSFRRGGRHDADLAGQPRSVGSGTNAGSGVNAGQAPTGESITLADLKVGDSVAGRGSIKNGVFVPTELHVFEPGARGRRGPGASANGASANGAPAGRGEPGGTQP